MYLPKIATIVDQVVLEFHCWKNFDPFMLRLQVQLHLHIVKSAYLHQNTLFKSFKCK